MPFLLRTFTDFIPAGVHFSASQPYVLGFGVILVCAVSLLAGFYPAIVLSSWKPVQVLKGQLYQGSAGRGKFESDKSSLSSNSHLPKPCHGYPAGRQTDSFLLNKTLDSIKSLPCGSGRTIVLTLRTASAGTLSANCSRSRVWYKPACATTCRLPATVGPRVWIIRMGKTRSMSMRSETGGYELPVDLSYFPFGGQNDRPCRNIQRDGDQ